MPTLAPGTGSFALFTEVPDQEKKKKKNNHFTCGIMYCSHSKVNYQVI